MRRILIIGSIVLLCLIGRVSQTTCDSPNMYLHRGARSGNIEAVRKALKAGADVNWTMSGKTALIAASQKGYTGIIHLLLAYDADVNATAGGGVTALITAAYYGHPEIVKLLLANGADVTT